MVVMGQILGFPHQTELVIIWSISIHPSVALVIALIGSRKLGLRVTDCAPNCLIIPSHLHFRFSDSQTKFNIPPNWVIGCTSREWWVDGLLPPDAKLTTSGVSRSRIHISIGQKADRQPGNSICGRYRSMYIRVFICSSWWDKESFKWISGEQRNGFKL